MATETVEETTSPTAAQKRLTDMIAWLQLVPTDDDEKTASELLKACNDADDPQHQEACFRIDDTIRNAESGNVDAGRLANALASLQGKELELPPIPDVKGAEQMAAIHAAVTDPTHPDHAAAMTAAQQLAVAAAAASNYHNTQSGYVSIANWTHAIKSVTKLLPPPYSQAAGFLTDLAEDTSDAAQGHAPNKQHGAASPSTDIVAYKGAPKDESVFGRIWRFLFGG